MNMVLPEYVLDCLNRLEKAGYQAWAVGGCVRDALLGKPPQDYDLCTDALPERTQALFSDRELVLAGLKHGTVGVVTPGGVVEITTFRTEGDYEDGRHPQWVHFVPELREDLRRRDFTVNAMAWSRCGACGTPSADRRIWKTESSGRWESRNSGSGRMRCASCGGCGLPAGSA